MVIWRTWRARSDRVIFLSFLMLDRVMDQNIQPQLSFAQILVRLCWVSFSLTNQVGLPLPIRICFGLASMVWWSLLLAFHPAAPPFLVRTTIQLLHTIVLWLVDFIKKTRNICDTKWAHYENIVYDISNVANKLIWCHKSCYSFL
jgi:hypothetical protein